jgi:hypothetical protein
MSAKIKIYSDYEQREEVIRLSNDKKSSREIQELIWVHNLTVCKIRESYWFTTPIKAWRKPWYHLSEADKARLKKSSTKHWLRDTKFYRMFYAATQRCTNPKATWYKDYWWRWIKIQWKTFKDYYNDMYKLYKLKVKIIWEKDISIERIDVDWDYCKSNTTYIPKLLQSSNQQRQKRLKT